MPWDELGPMDQRRGFIEDLLTCGWTMTELCRHYGISRKTGYKWSLRHFQAGLPGLGDRSRRPHHSPHRTPQWLEEALVDCRRAHPDWGGRKLVKVLGRREPDWPLPAPSTVGALLKRNGLVTSRRGRRRGPPAGKPTVEAAAPNAVWACDFKGQFRLGDRSYCFPLTISDLCSRYLLCCHGLPSTAEHGVRPVFERVFRQVGLPAVMLTDNGLPFASPALSGLSRLSLWWIKLGIRPVRIQPGRPQQNGSHERMHRTLKAGTARPPATDPTAQQSAFDRFRSEFNDLRPHESLGMRTPAELYQASPRPFPSKLPDVEYPGHFEVRSVRPTGDIRWRGCRLFVSEVLARERVGLEEVDDGIWSLYFGPVLLARFDERERKLHG
jgi:putative transposase